MWQVDHKKVLLGIWSRRMLTAVFCFLFTFWAACSGPENEPSAGDSQLYACGMHPQVMQEEPGTCPICQMNLTPMVATAHAAEAHEGRPEGGGRSETTGRDREREERRVLYWQAPMDPSYIADEPGKSPMGMDLIPVYEGEKVYSGSTISIDPATVQNIGVRYAAVKRQPFNRVIRTVGHLDYNEETLYNVSTKFSGWIEELLVKRTGDVVRKGQPLFQIYSPELLSTQEEYLLAFRNQKRLSGSDFSQVSSGAQSLFKAARQRLKLWDISDADIRTLEESGQVMKSLTIYSPASGVVVHKNAIAGSYVKAGMDLFRIADLSTIWVYAHIFEYEVPWIRAGQEAEIELPYIPGKRYVGKVDYVYPYLDQKTRDVKIRLVFQNRDFELKPQMYANIRIQSSGGLRELVIPTEAIMRSGQRNLVFVQLGEGKFRPQEVVIGPEGEGGMIKVISGLQEGQKIVTSAQFLIDSESRLREAIQKMLDDKNSAKRPGARKPDATQVHDMEAQEGHQNGDGNDLQR